MENCENTLFNTAQSLEFGKYILLASILTLPFINCSEFIFLTKLLAVRFPYKHRKFVVDMSIYPECNAWRHLFPYGGFRSLLLKVFR